MKNVLITGSAGFIGCHLAKYLQNNGHFAIGIDNFNAYYDVSLKRQRQKLLKQSNVEILEEDIQNTQYLVSIIKKYKITHVVNLAAQAGVRHSLKNPKDYVDSNLIGFVSVLEAIKNFPHVKLVFASSSSVYGLNTTLPFSPSHATDRPTNLYGATKKANESLAYAYHHLYGNPTVGLRYFTVYGPWGRPDMAYFQFTQKILNNIPIDIFNNGLLKRDFTYIDDIVEGTANALDFNGPYEIFNLGNNTPIELLKFIELLEKFLDKKALKNFKPMQKEEMLITCADISKSRNLLNFNPKTKIEGGLKKFVSWFFEYNSDKITV